MMRRIATCLCMILVTLSAARAQRAAASALRADVDSCTVAVTKIYNSDDVDGGIAMLTRLINRSEAKSGYSATNLATYYNGRAGGYIKKRQYEQAVPDYLHAIELLQQAGAAGHKDLSNTWSYISIAYYQMDKLDDAIQAANQSVETAQSYYGPNHSMTLDAYETRSNYAGFAGDTTLALHDRKACFDIIRRNVERNFTYLTAAERDAYWNKYMPMTTVMFTFAHKLHERQSDFTDALFDQQLLAKGLLLTAESALQRAVDSDTALAATYRQIRALRRRAASDNTTPTTAQNATLEADRLERDMGANAAALHRFTDFLKVHHDDVQRRLTDDDIAIEFVDYRVGKDSTMYAALVMTPRAEHVRFIPLAEQSELEANSDNLSDMLWQPILASLDREPSNIYFAPTGILYQIPIESHPTPTGGITSATASGSSSGTTSVTTSGTTSGKANATTSVTNMCDRYNMFRLSSTRQLALKDTGTTDAAGATTSSGASGAAIYGGLQYDLTVADMEADSRKYPNLQRSAQIDNDIVDRIAGVSLKYLPGTLAEAQTIAKEMNDANIASLTPTLYVGANGTEASFKALSGLHKRIVHIGTHGFFTSKVSDPMQGSGLCFAGANNKYRRIAIPAGTDDGILTAQEIATLDLDGLDLVVLSACQSGLGAITTDGVQGLQRGFKKAGCNSIIMSLWNVDDEATRLLMTTFYKYYLSGKSKREALELAKQAVRNTSKWSKPKFWTAFILLDAI